MLQNYGLLKARVKVDNEESRSHKGMTHYNLIATPDGGDDYQVNIDVQSDPRKANVRVLYIKNYQQYNSALTDQLDALADGVLPINSRPDGLALDYIREQLLNVRRLKHAKPIRARGIGKLLDKFIEKHERVVIFGTTYQDGQDEQHTSYGLRRRDKRKELPPRGIHNVHYNQGSTGSHKDDNGAYQDGALFIKDEDGSYTAFFFAFAEQCFCVNEKGNCDCGH